ncbi:MAG TPA: hypothetical protein PKE47_09270 [Verrucomicrobiota bacterium]|nr:hypothetical protein [Verrucomicrobiota bacterium]
MKSSHLLALGLLALRLPADEPAPLAAAPAKLAVPPAAAATPPAAAETETAATAAAEVLPAGLSFAPASETPPEGFGGTGASQSDLQFSESLLGEVETELTTPRVSTNVVRVQGIAPRAVKPSRFGSFFQLFNPLAPAGETMEAQTVSWYDGQLNTAPRPRALRDEKTETPVGGVVVSVGR